MKRNLLTFFLMGLLLTVNPAVLNAQPEVEWQQTYGGEDEDQAMDAFQTEDGGYLVVGYDELFGQVEWDGWIVKTDENGDSLWSREYGGDASDFLFYGMELDGGDFVFSGRTQSLGNDEEFWLVKTDNEG